jgi:hypothetical protein
MLSVHLRVCVRVSTFAADDKIVDDSGAIFVVSVSTFSIVVLSHSVSLSHLVAA